jgi:putative Ca2+/H+ antiporter (TMEM165/GDT1 family)
MSRPLVPPPPPIASTDLLYVSGETRAASRQSLRNIAVLSAVLFLLLAMMGILLVVALGDSLSQ